MRRSLIIVVLAAVSAAGAIAPSTASASKYLSKSAAKADARQMVRDLYRDDYGLYGVRVQCKPQYGVRYVTGYTYRRWVCYWQATDDQGDVAYGALRIVGAPGDGYFIWKVVVGIHWL